MVTADPKVGRLAELIYDYYFGSDRELSYTEAEEMAYRIRNGEQEPFKGLEGLQ